SQWLPVSLTPGARVAVPVINVPLGVHVGVALGDTDAGVRVGVGVAPTGAAWPGRANNTAIKNSAGKASVIPVALHKFLFIAKPLHNCGASPVPRYNAHRSIPVE